MTQKEVVAFWKQSYADVWLQKATGMRTLLTSYFCVMSQADATILLKKYVKLISHKYPVQSVYLFGSFAKGFTHEGSDIDVCIVSPVFGKDYFDEEMDLRRETLNVDSRIEPVAFNPVDFDDKYNLLVHEIKTHGIQIL